MPSFFLIKKNDAVYGDLDGQMVPLPRCSLTNLRSSASSGCDKGMSFPGRDTGAPGLSSMAWSQIHDRGNSCDASSEYSGVLTVLLRYFVKFGRGGLFDGIYHDSSNEVSVCLTGVRTVDLLWDESCLHGIRGSEYDG